MMNYNHQWTFLVWGNLKRNYTKYSFISNSFFFFLLFIPSFPHNTQTQTQKHTHTHTDIKIHKHKDRRTDRQTDSLSLYLLSFLIVDFRCTIAEFWLEDGNSLFDYSELLAYCKKEHDPTIKINKIKDKNIRSLILHMIQREPEKRSSASVYLKDWYVPMSIDLSISI
jgi:serine/threonine protein kinase